MNILIVDDSPFARLQLRAMLEEHGHSVIGEAEDAPSACTRYLELKPDVMTLDMVMPGGGGLHVLMALQVTEPSPRIVVVSSLNEESMAPVKELGVRHILHKPVAWPQLEQALEELSR